MSALWLDFKKAPNSLAKPKIKQGVSDVFSCTKKSGTNIVNGDGSGSKVVTHRYDIVNYSPLKNPDFGSKISFPNPAPYDIALPPNIARLNFFLFSQPIC